MDVSGPVRASHLAYRPGFPVLQLGVVGHRELPQDGPRLREAVAEVLQAVADQAGTVTARTEGRWLWQTATPVLRCVSGLAEGADQLVADEALGLGFALSAVLPFARPDYERDFETEAARIAFSAAIDRAASVLELDGTRDDPAQAYLDCGRVVLEQSDLLLAVWDGHPARGVGGTGSIVREAQERGIPVIVVASAEPHHVRLLGRAADWREALGAEVAHALLPGPGTRAHSLETLFAAPAQDAAWARFVCAIYERLVLLGAPVADRARSARPADRDQARPAETTDTIGSAFDWADQLAIAYGNRYRAASILKVTVPTLSIIGLFVGFYGGRFSLPDWAEPLGFALQAVALGGVLALFHINKRRAWHARFLDFRYIAEQLRFAGTFARLGSIPPLPRPAPFQPGSAPDWASAYLRSVLRVPGLVASRLTPETVQVARMQAEALIREQIAFYEARCLRFDTMARRLNGLADVCYWAGFVLVCLRAAVYFGWPADSDRQAIANMIILVVPALAPIFLGLRAQGEYARLAQRYRAMVSELQTILADLNAPDANSRRVQAVLHQAAALILGEVADWRVLIQARSISRL